MWLDDELRMVSLESVSDHFRIGEFIEFLFFETDGKSLDRLSGIPCHHRDDSA